MLFLSSKKANVIFKHICKVVWDIPMLNAPCKCILNSYITLMARARKTDSNDFNLLNEVVVYTKTYLTT